jgi:NAD(P)-dependent dehydrogenase (short-subunit alcohol dehydrogenase family)
MPVSSDLPVAVVTGGNRGVGLEVCRQLALLGFGVVLGSRDLRRGELAAKELDPEGVRIVACQLEVDNSISVAAMADWVKGRFGRTDVLVNNASTMYDRWATASNADLGTVAEALDVNLFGPWRVIHALLPMLRSSSRPRIVNVSSEGGSISTMTGGPQRADPPARRGTGQGRHTRQCRLPGLARQREPPGRPFAGPGRGQRDMGGDDSQRRPHRHLDPRRPAFPLVADGPYGFSAASGSERASGSSSGLGWYR